MSSHSCCITARVKNIMLRMQIRLWWNMELRDGINTNVIQVTSSLDYQVIIQIVIFCLLWLPNHAVRLSFYSSFAN